MAALCELRTLGRRCHVPARYGVYWTATAEDVIPACGRHLAKAIEELRRQPHVAGRRDIKVYVVDRKS